MGCTNSVRTIEKQEKHKHKKETLRSIVKSDNFPEEQLEIINSSQDIKINHDNLISKNEKFLAKEYEIKKIIGKGAFGKVYKVYHKKTKQYRAMKTVKKDCINYQDDEHFFLKEIEVLRLLDHPNILKIFEFYTDDLNYYVMTELIEGGDLYDEIYKMKSMQEKDTAVIMMQLLSAVSYMHSKNIVHRDIKPENILLENKCNKEIMIKLIDFGNSNYVDKSTHLSLKVGTPYYIAPEILSKDYNHKCDIWSCGVIMYLLLMGGPPFDGPDEQAIIHRVKSGQYSYHNTEYITFEAKDLIDKMLTYDYNQRISADEALNHVWIKKYSQIERENLLHYIKEESHSDYKKPFENLKKFSARQKLQQATLAFLFHQLSTTEMIKDLKCIFRQIDENGDGILSYDEIKKGFKTYYRDEKIAEKELDEIIKNIDLDKNEFIEYEEFLRSAVNPEMLLTDKNLALAFSAFDKDGSGLLSLDEIKNALGILSNQESSNVIKNIMKEIDTNGDGNISFSEFKELMIKVMNQ
jgi:calcium-dependent protein kinase